MEASPMMLWEWLALAAVCFAMAGALAAAWGEIPMLACGVAALVLFGAAKIVERGTP